MNNVGKEYINKDKEIGFWRDTHIRIKGESVDTCRYVKALPVIRNSCGCDLTTMRDVSIARTYEVELMESLITHNAYNTFVSISLEKNACFQQITGSGSEKSSSKNVKNHC